MTACKNKPVNVVQFGRLIDFVWLQAKGSLFTTEDHSVSIERRLLHDLEVETLQVPNYVWGLLCRRQESTSKQVKFMFCWK